MDHMLTCSDIHVYFLVLCITFCFLLPSLTKWRQRCSLNCKNIFALCTCHRGFSILDNHLLLYSTFAANVGFGATAELLPRGCAGSAKKVKRWEEGERKSRFKSWRKLFDNCSFVSRTGAFSHELNNFFYCLASSGIEFHYPVIWKITSHWYPHP